MMQVDAVVTMLQPGFNVPSIAAKRRNKGKPCSYPQDPKPFTVVYV